MPTQNNTLTRRTFLKGAAYTSALSAGSLSSLAFANSASSGQEMARQTNKPNGTNGGSLLAVTLSNKSDYPVALDARQPVKLEQVNGWVVVAINKAKAGGAVATGQQINLAAGQECSFPVDAELAPMLSDASAYIVITNEYSILDNMVPLTPANAMFA